MNGNITKEGIKLDLEWMKRVGIGGFQNFDASIFTPQVVDKRLVYMTPEWKEAFLYATQLADKLGLEMAIAGSPGWSESGGPWVKPAQGMKKVVWSETRIQGGKPFAAVLPKPPDTTGPFQNIEKTAGILAANIAPASHYADSAVIAFRAPASEADGQTPVVTSSGGKIDSLLLADGDLSKTVSLPAPKKGERAWIQFEYAKPQSVYALTLTVRVAEGPLSQFTPASEGGAYLQSSDDGVKFVTIATLPSGGLAQHTSAFPKTTARFFRIAFDAPVAPPNPFSSDDPLFASINPAAPKDFKVAELVLHASARAHRFEEKAAFAALPDLSPLPTPSASADAAVAKESVIDLTSKMRPDGTLDWNPPAGDWVVLRFGYSLTGHTNSPASAEATGLEVDKLSKAHVKAYFETYLDMYKETTKGLMGKRGLQYVITDSWEAGVQNWTEEMTAEFAKRRGYDLRLWLPALAGYVIESGEATDRFLWDFRKTLGDLVTEHHYDQLTEILRQRGMGRYSESHESGRAFIGDGMEVKRNATIPMSAMWTQAPGVNSEQYGYNADIRESASVAHLYGQNLVAAESLTAFSGGWSWSPETLKPTADKELAMGLNRFVIHTSVHQPLIDKKPGLGLGPFGQWFNRNESWAEQAKPWVDYLSRCSYMLQQGRFVADVLYFYGEDSNVTALFAAKSPDIPAGYSFDYVNADALLHIIKAQRGRMTTKSGMNYRVLVLDPHCRQASVPVLRKIAEIAKAGVAIVGAKPESPLSLSDNPEEFRALVSQIWGSNKANVYTGKPLASVLPALKIEPDFVYGGIRGDANLLFVHRNIQGGDLYFVSNRNNRGESVEVAFRVSGKVAELWRPDTGKTEPISFRMENGGTRVPLELAPYESVFVVFRKATDDLERTVPPASPLLQIVALEGAWQVSFQANRGAPERVALDKLSSWSESADPGVRFFSGKAIYAKTVQAPADWLTSEGGVWLDLGDVKNIAEVFVNGRPLGTLWKPPFRVDIKDALKEGENTLEIGVTNLWVNRLIGDLQPNAKQKHAFSVFPFYNAKSPLKASGLLGPVRLLK